jgi:CheY-like chemotaxis protein
LDSRDLVAQLGSEVATLLSSALDRVVELTASGRIDRSGLRALRDEIAQARRAGILGQQWVRLTSGDLKLQRERLDLTQLLRDVLQQRGREIETRGVQVRQQFEQADVLSDPTLLFSLLQALLDWAFQHTVSRVDLRLDIKSWPSHARLACAYSYLPPDEVPAEQPARGSKEEARLSTMSWQLLQQTAHLLGLPLQRIDSAGRTQLLIEFPDTVTARLDASEDLQGMEADDSGLQDQQSQPLAGQRVLVLAPRREVRAAVREALRSMGLMISIVSSIDEALQVCAAALPHALVYEEGTAGDEFDLLRDGLLRESPQMAFINIAEEGKAFEVLNLGGRQFASVGRAAIMDSLPAALLFELSRHQ